MKRNLLKMKSSRWAFALLLCLFSLPQTMLAGDTLYVKETEIPMLIEAGDNVLYYLRLDAKDGIQTLDDVNLSFAKDCDWKNIESVKLYYGGTEAMEFKGKLRFSPQNYVSSWSSKGKPLSALPSYSMLLQKNAASSVMSFPVHKKLFPGINYFWISVEFKPTARLSDHLVCESLSAKADGKNLPLNVVSPTGIIHRTAVGVRHAGDDGAAAYRIPGLVTTDKGTLLAVYDIRYNSSVDLQERIDIGLSRSTDGGRTWEPMRVAMSFGEYGGLPASQNGVGDPSILYDPKTHTAWIVAAWSHGQGNRRSWWNSGQGMTVNETDQLMMVKSTDDGQTWSEPINVTEQVKDPTSFFLLQGPGRGITMSDGTLVFPTQQIDSTRVPNAGLMYSKDGGKSWKMHKYARTNTTEAQVAEVEPGVLMLNMRDNRGGSRAVSITKDLGKTWTEHISNRSALPEPVCMASLIHVGKKENVLKKDLLLFSNPNTTKGRNHITIKASLDGGVTWLPEHQIMLDAEDGWGYTCLTMVDEETVGILYESSVAHMTYQTISLKELIK